MDFPLVSIIIPFYSGKLWLKEALKSVFLQTYTKFEVFLINDGSDEDIEDIIEKYSGKLIYKYKENGGPASARNLGIELAKGKYIAFLDSDDIWLKNKLEQQVRLMELKNVNWSHTNYIQFLDGNENQYKSFNLEKYSGEIFPASLLSTHIATPTVMIRTSFLKKRKLKFNNSMRFGQDYFLWLQLSQIAILELVPEILCKVRIQGKNASKRARAHIQVRGQIWKNLKNDETNIFYKEWYFFIIRWFYIYCYYGYKLVLQLEKNSSLSDNSIELLSKIFFFIPYSFFKIFHRVFVFFKGNKC